MEGWSLQTPRSLGETVPEKGRGSAANVARRPHSTDAPRVARAPRATQVLVTVCRSDSSWQWRSQPQGPPRVREAWGARRSRGSVPLFPSGCREELCSRGLRRQGTGWQSAAFWVSVAGALAALGLESQGPAPRARHRGKRQPRVVSMRLKWQRRVSSASGSCPPNPAWGQPEPGREHGAPAAIPGLCSGWGQCASALAELRGAWGNLLSSEWAFSEQRCRDTRCGLLRVSTLAARPSRRVRFGA